jgi:CheY-like chemotaxis protein
MTDGRHGQENINILLVDDNAFIRSVLMQCLLHIGFRRLEGCASGVDAIEIIREMQNGKGSHRSLSGPVDIVISDLVMPQLSGLQLLEWLRTDKDSPNRFIPFIMISGAADQSQVHLSRDAGANEFVAKPFSIGSVFSRIQAVIDRPRQYVATRSYFGPDRRRNSKNNKLPKDVPKSRRREGEGHATVVYSAKDIKRPAKSADTYLFKLPNLLKQKMGLEHMREPFELPKELLAEAEQTLEREARGFLDWAKQYLDQLSTQIASAKEDQTNRGAHLAEVNRIAHELRGQGGTFGYPLITLFAKSLYEATEYPCREDDANLEICRAHLDTLRAVIREKIEGDGGAIGRQLLMSLNQAITKYTH